MDNLKKGLIKNCTIIMHDDSVIDTCVLIDCKLKKDEDAFIKLTNNFFSENVGIEEDQYVNGC